MTKDRKIMSIVTTIFVLGYEAGLKRDDQLNRRKTYNLYLTLIDIINGIHDSEVDQDD